MENDVAQYHPNDKDQIGYLLFILPYTVGVGVRVELYLVQVEAQMLYLH